MLSCRFIFIEENGGYTARMENPRYVIGIDEVGRGPLAGPVAVCALRITPRLLLRFKTIKESKQLSERQREIWYGRMLARTGPELSFAVSFVGARIIDEKGIQYAIRLALTRSLRKLHARPDQCLVLLDGGLYAPKAYAKQRTIIRGDATKTVIAMASVVAKITRDRLMSRLHAKHPAYGFARHKGYGTMTHYAAIRKHGLSEQHRKSFLRTLYVH